MGGRFMIGPLVFLLALMRMDQRRVVVLVQPELAEHAARLVMNHVIVVVGMNDSGMRMRMLLVANDTLAGACLLQRRPPLLRLSRVPWDLRWGPPSEA